MNPEPVKICQQTQEAFLSVAHNKSSEAAVLKHSSVCDSCREAYEKYLEVGSQLSDAAQAVPESDDFVNRVLAEIKFGAPPSPLSNPHDDADRSHLKWPLLLVGASMLLSVGLIMISPAFDDDSPDPPVPFKKSEQAKSEAELEKTPEREASSKPIKKARESEHRDPSSSVSRAMASYLEREQFAASRSRLDGKIGARKLRKIRHRIADMPFSTAEQWQDLASQLEAGLASLKDKRRLAMRREAIKEARLQITVAKSKNSKSASSHPKE
jgi:hypothetical protein